VSAKVQAPLTLPCASVILHYPAMVALWQADNHVKVSAIDMLPAGLNFEVFEKPELQIQDPELASSRSGLSQHVENYDLDDEQVVPDNQPVTPDITIATESPKHKRRTLE